MIMPILSVKDVDASIAFYTEKLGFAHQMSMPGPDGKNTFAFVSLGEAIMVGLSLDPDLQHRGAGVDLMFYVPDTTDIDQVYNEVQSRGVGITETIDTRYWGDRTFGLRDPDGYSLTFAKTVKQVPMEEIEAHLRGGGA
jgi:uncharacterized glyoxalase superfamily protein PhnB